MRFIFMNRGGLMAALFRFFKKGLFGLIGKGFVCVNQIKIFQKGVMIKMGHATIVRAPLAFEMVLKSGVIVFLIHKFAQLFKLF